MQIEIKAGTVRLERYAGAESIGGKRRSHRVRVGQFPEHALPEFATSESDIDSGRISWEIYRNTTPIEHECILEFMQMHHRAKAAKQLLEVVATLERISNFDKLEVPEALVKRLQSAVRKVNRCVSTSGNNVTSTQRDDQLEGGEMMSSPTMDASVPAAVMHPTVGRDEQTNPAPPLNSEREQSSSARIDIYQSYQS